MGSDLLKFYPILKQVNNIKSYWLHIYLITFKILGNCKKSGQYTFPDIIAGIYRS